MWVWLMRHSRAVNWCAGASRAIVSHRQIAYVPFVSIIAYVSVIGFWCVGGSAISAGEQPSVIEQEQARQALQVLRGVEPDVGQTLDVTVAGTAESVHLPRAAFELIRDVLANMAAGTGHHRRPGTCGVDHAAGCSDAQCLSPTCHQAARRGTYRVLVGGPSSPDPRIVADCLSTLSARRRT